MLTKEERDIVVEAMRKYPAGVSSASWGKSPEFVCDGFPSCYDRVEDLEDAILLKHG